MFVRQLDFGGNLILAPMAGVSDVGFRDVAMMHGCDATYSEMLSARAMLHNPHKTSLMTIYSENESLRIGQIFGHEPEIMEKALNSELISHYHVIDINMGCPAPKIVKNGEGSALLDNLPLASKIILACRKACDRPLSVKFRLGKRSDNSLEIGRMCQDCGADYVTLHARTAEQGYSGKADLEAIARLKSALKIPVVGNGDVTDEQSYKAMLATGVDAVMIGRGAMGKPYIFNQLKGTKEDIDLMAIIKRHVEVLRRYYDEDWLVKYMRKHFLWYASALKGEERIKLATSGSIENSLQIIERYLKGQKVNN